MSKLHITSAPPRRARPLEGRRIVITRAREQSPDLVERLIKLGAQPVECPAISIIPLRDPAPLDATITRLESAQIVNLDVMLARRKMRSKELAERAGITEQNISLLKSGKVKGVRFDTLERICDAFNRQPRDILEYRPTSDAERVA